MKREIDFKTMTDGKRYRSDDMAKLGCGGCKGCSECCSDQAVMIVLTPYDMAQLTKKTGKNFDTLYSEGRIRLNTVDGLILPGLGIKNGSTQGGNVLRESSVGTASSRDTCVFLGEDGRCSIHDARPDICRLFPLARLYEDEGVSYILQTGECPMADGVKVRISKWLDLPELKSYEKWMLEYHGLLMNVRAALSEYDDESMKQKINIGFLNLFFRTPYDEARPFFEQYKERAERMI